jgi:hypothetical protein
MGKKARQKETHLLGIEIENIEPETGAAAGIT